jgi:hypothetical protein
MSPSCDTVPGYLRAIAAVVVVALVGGWVVLLAFASDLDHLFVWPVKPHLSAFMLGSAYAAGTYYWLRVLLGARWHAIQAGLLPVALFAAAMGLATALHWSRFHHGGALIVIWVGLYVSVPIALPVIWALNRGRDPRGIEGAEPLVPLAARLALASVGLAQLALGVTLFAAPEWFVGSWAWPLTDLTARVTAAWFAWGLVWLMAVGDRRWSALRIPVEATLVGVLVALLGLARGWSELERSRAVAWLLVIGLAAAAVCLVALHVAMECRSRRHAPLLPPLPDGGESA